MAIQDELRIKEYEKLNREVEFIVAECARREQYSVTIIAAIAAWIFGNDKTDFDGWKGCIAFIPLITTLLFAFSIWMFTNRLMTMRAYIQTHIFEGETCWDKYVAESNKAKKSSVMAYAGMYWLIQIGICIVLIVIVMTR
jgi:hypothetical protein